MNKNVSVPYARGSISKQRSSGSHQMTKRSNTVVALVFIHKVPKIDGIPRDVREQLLKKTMEVPVTQMNGETIPLRTKQFLKYLHPNQKTFFKGKDTVHVDKDACTVYKRVHLA